LTIKGQPSSGGEKPMDINI